MSTYYQKSGFESIDMPAGTGISELETSLETVVEESGYEFTGPVRHTSSELRDLIEEDLEDADTLLEKAEAVFPAFPGSLILAPYGGLEAAINVVEPFINRDKKRYTLTQKHDNQTHIVCYHDSSTGREVYVGERHPVTPHQLGDRYYEPEPELVQELEEEIERLAP